MGRGEAPRALEGICVGIKDEVPITGQPCSMGSLLHRDEIADGHRPDGRAHPRRRWHRTRADDHAGILDRRLHALAAVGRDAQPVEPRVRRRRLVRRHRRVAGVGHLDARHRLRHRRLDPHAGRLERRRRVQGAVRPCAAAAAVQHGHLLPQRAAGAHHRRLRAVRERDRRAAPGRRRRDRAAVRAAGDVRGHRRHALALCVRPDDWPVDDDVAAAIRDAAGDARAVRRDGRGGGDAGLRAGPHDGAGRRALRAADGSGDGARDGAPRPAVRVHHRGVRRERRHDAGADPRGADRRDEAARRPRGASTPRTTRCCGRPARRAG